MLKILGTRFVLATAALLTSSGAMAVALDVNKASNGMTGLYSFTFAGALPACGPSSPSYCAFFGGNPTPGQIAATPVSPNPTGLTTNIPGGIGPTGIPVAPAPGPGSSLNLVSDGVTSTLTGGTINIGSGTISLLAVGLTVTYSNAGIVLDPGVQVAAVNGNGHSEFLVNLSPNVAADFSRFSQIVANPTGCTGPAPSVAAYCPLIFADVLNLDMIKYRLLVQWDPTFTNFTSKFIGQTANNSMVFANLDTVPVPAAVWLLGSALGVLGWMRRRAAA